jgi:hypothetical protein
VPILSVVDFFRQYRLSDEIRRLLLGEKFETAGAVLEALENRLTWRKQGSNRVKC